MSRFSAGWHNFSALLRVRLPQYLKTPVLVCFFLSSLMALIVLASYMSIQPVVPLFYSLPQPNDYLVPKIWLAVFPILSFIITLSHLIWLKSIQTYEKVIQQLYIWLTVIIQLVFLLALIRIIWIIV